VGVIDKNNNGMDNGNNIIDTVLSWPTNRATAPVSPRPGPKY